MLNWMALVLFSDKDLAKILKGASLPFLNQKIHDIQYVITMRILRRTCIIVTLFVILLATRTRDKTKILIIGDSISIGYTPFVKKSLKNRAEIFHNPGNAQHTGKGLKKIEEWIGDEDWDIIQFNWGLWDLCYRHPDSETQGNRDKINGKITYPIDDYASNLDSIVKLMKNKTDAQLIFVTTTFVPEDEAGRYTGDAKRYNEIAKSIMTKNHVIINDIYENSIAIHDRFGKDKGNVHYTQDGYKQLGSLISGFLRQEIKKKKN